jgi:Signal transduction histidine kinase
VRTLPDLDVQGMMIPRLCLTQDMPGSAAPMRTPPRLAWVAAAVCLILPIMYLGIMLADPAQELLYTFGIFDGAVSYFACACLQSVLLVGLPYLPRTVLIAAIVMYLVTVAGSGGTIGIGTAPVMFAVWWLARYQIAQLWFIVVVGISCAVIVMVAVVYTARLGLTVILVGQVASALLMYVAPAALGRYMLGRELLNQALEEKAELLERDRRGRLERELTASRNALARDVHDIAGHHLSGVIIATQAASALTRIDPERARQMLQTAQESARTALADLRRTVGLLRGEGEKEPVANAEQRPVPSLSAIADLIADARSRGQHVDYTTLGDPQSPGPLAETVAYRMVQESLANSAQHAPGAPCQVLIVHQEKRVSITVSNSTPPEGTVPMDRGEDREGHGLSGMAERAALVGARLSAGPRPDGGWYNHLVIPTGNNRLPPTPVAPANPEDPGSVAIT